MDDWFDAGGRGSPVDVAAALDGKGWEHIVAMVAAGALVSIGTTSDGGALGVNVTVDGRSRREYFRDGAELGEWLEGGLGPVLDAAELARGARASSGSRKRPRPR